ncbi:MAG: DNA repair protein RecO [Flammeovirgaceae bacterium]|nr:DNA repair protein RecO [Flammeovirgaceae bacterium]
MSDRIHKTRGIVFRATKYRDTSLIVTIFTEQFGLQTYMVNSIRSSSPKSRIALFQPLTLLDMVVYHRDVEQIFRIKEYRCDYPFQTLMTNLNKSALAMFLGEVLNKAVKDQSHPEEIFNFIKDSLILLDQMDLGFENFHLIFLLKLSRLLGFGPQRVSEIVTDGFTGHQEVLEKLLHRDFDFKIKITSVERADLLKTLLEFYNQHVDHFGQVKSVQVLQEIFKN